jgi:plastocyanin domain-containing protein
VAIRRGIGALRRWLCGEEPRTRTLRVDWRVGEEPRLLLARAGEPIRISFRRFGSHRESESVWFPELGILTLLATARETLVDLGHRRPGRYRFRAIEGELEGWLVVTA